MKKQQCLTAQIASMEGVNPKSRSSFLLGSLFMAFLSSKQHVTHKQQEPLNKTMENQTDYPSRLLMEIKAVEYDTDSFLT